eukprot:1159607-Pelagomonas_calceolata.AAC.2
MQGFRQEEQMDSFQWSVIKVGHTTDAHAMGAASTMRAGLRAASVRGAEVVVAKSSTGCRAEGWLRLCRWVGVLVQDVFLSKKASVCTLDLPGLHG